MVAPGREQSLAKLVATRRVLLVCGLGGVGKTTVAAAIALAASRAGRPTVVLTIDPAPRLADALGVAHAPDDEPTPVAVASDAPLYALKLDPGRVFDRAVMRAVTDPDARERILANRIYRQLSRVVAGSEEFTAMERLNELLDDERFELVIVDTPPSAHALDFLEAPTQVVSFLRSRTLAMLAGGGSLGARLAGRGARTALAALARAAGVEVLRELGEFFDALAGAAEQLAARSQRTHAVLTGAQTAVVAVTVPERRAVADTIAFMERVRELGMALGAVVANRVHDAHGLEATALADLQTALAAAVGENLARKVAAVAADHVRAAAHDQAALATLERWLAEHLEQDGDRPAFARLPLLESDVRSLAELERVAALLCGRDRA